MKIEAGDTVELNNGDVFKVERMNGNDPGRVGRLGFGAFVINGYKYYGDGRGVDCGSAHPLSVKRIISRASDDTPKPWRDMTDEEKAKVPDDVLNDPANPLRIPWNEWGRAAKGALLLADNEGKAIEYWAGFGEGWERDPKFAPHPPFYDAMTYRIKDEPVRETVTIDDKTYSFRAMRGHRITFDLIDGEPDCEKCDTCGSAKHVNMEKV